MSLRNVKTYTILKPSKQSKMEISELYNMLTYMPNFLVICVSMTFIALALIYSRKHRRKNIELHQRIKKLNEYIKNRHDRHWPD